MTIKKLKHILVSSCYLLMAFCSYAQCMDENSSQAPELQKTITTQEIIGGFLSSIQECIDNDLNQRFETQKTTSIQETMKDFTNYLWTAIIGDQDNGSSTALYMCYPGIPVDSSTFDQMQSTNNPTGNILPLELFSSMVNEIPDSSKYVWNPSGKKVSNAYSLILEGANTTSGEFTEKEQRRYEQARKILYVTKPSLFDDLPPTEVQSPLYAEYEQKRNTYQNAINNLNTVKYGLDMRDPADQLKWLTVGPQLQNNVDNAWSAWNAAYKTEIETAIAIMGTTLKNGLAREISRSQQVLNQSTVPSMQQVGGVAWHPVRTMPVEWWNDKNNNWTRLEISSKKSHTNFKDYHQSFGVGAGFSNGLLSLNGKFGFSKKFSDEKDDSTNLALSMEFSTVLLQRDWLNIDWLSSPSWYLGGYKEESISTGDRTKNTNAHVLPLIPTRMIVARNIELVADWGNSTKETFEKAIKGELKVGYGPFNISGTYDQNEKEKTVTSEFDGKKLRIHGTQILGFIGTVPSKSALQKDPNLV